MKSSSAILLLVSCLVLVFLYACSYFKKTSSEQQSYYTKFRDPNFFVTFSWVSEDETPAIENFFKNRKEARSLEPDELKSNEDFGYEIRLDSKNSEAIVEVFKEILLWNKGIINVGKDKKAQIPSSNAT